MPSEQGLVESRMIKKEEVYKIGRLGKTHGVNGEITFQFDDDIFDTTDGEYLILEIDGILVPFFMEEYRFKSDEVALVKFEDINTQGRAAELTGCEVFYPRISADASEGGELSYAQLVGFTLVDAKTEKAVGVIDYIDDQTDNIMFELEDGMLIPASEELIADVDVEKRTISMNLPEGLLDL